MQSQVVSGSRYVLKFHALHSQCTMKEIKNTGMGGSSEEYDSATAAECMKKENGAKRYLYTLDVWEQSWKNFFQVKVTSVEDAGNWSVSNA